MASSMSVIWSFSWLHCSGLREMPGRDSLDTLRKVYNLKSLQQKQRQAKNPRPDSLEEPPVLTQSCARPKASARARVGGSSSAMGAGLLRTQPPMKDGNRRNGCLSLHYQQLKVQQWASDTEWRWSVSYLSSGCSITDVKTSKGLNPVWVRETESVQVGSNSVFPGDPRKPPDWMNLGWPTADYLFSQVSSPHPGSSSTLWCQSGLSLWSPWHWRIASFQSVRDKIWIRH